jgi:hypothetical protein
MTVAKLAGGVKRRKDMLCSSANWRLAIFSYFDSGMGPAKRSGNRLLVALFRRHLPGSAG